ncbi:MAG: hypothetical protein NUK65_06685 [Firmicutes bacterium]|nr:hypothetical protein [Bacillota bacterium]
MFDKEFTVQRDIVRFDKKEEFYSKKNDVALFSFIDSRQQTKEWVVKKYCTGKTTKEKDILNYLYEGGLAVPELIYAGENHLVLQYLKGVTLLEWLERQEQHYEIGHASRQTIVNWADWFLLCYSLLEKAYGESMILGDVNWRNFILAETIYGLDFEDCRIGKREEDIGCLCAFALTYNPSFTPWKLKLVAVIQDVFEDKLSLSSTLISREMNKELSRMQERRDSKLLLH